MIEPKVEVVEGTNITLVSFGGHIQAAEVGTTFLCRTQEVVSSGRFVPKDRKGEIRGFVRPYTEGVTSNFIEVLWRGDIIPMKMKPEDLVL